jgi:mono/diheme cytochrome c family protein
MMKSLIFILILAPGHLVFLHSNSDDPNESIKRGEQVYLVNCLNCHMADGEGLEGTYPPLAKTGYAGDSIQQCINIILSGQKGEIVVNGVTYNSEMPAQDYLSDEEVADVLNYIMNRWGNKTRVITPDIVKSQRGK